MFFNSYAYVIRCCIVWSIHIYDYYVIILGLITQWLILAIFVLLILNAILSDIIIAIMIIYL